MRDRIHAAVWTGLALLLSIGLAGAAEVRVLSVGAVQVALKNLAADFSKETGHQVTFSIASPVVVERKLAAGEVHDVVILSAPAMDDLDKAGGVQAGSRMPLARVGIGVSVREGSDVPDISTPEAFKRTLLIARTIVHSDPTLPRQSGALVVGILSKAGILDEIRAKARIAGWSPGNEMVAKGEAEIGLFNISEIPRDKGVTFVGPVPAPLQLYNNYEAAVMARAAAPEPALALIKLLASAGSRDKWQAAGLEALPAR
jgi:molybdate transport system substrate-binding protein